MATLSRTRVIVTYGLLFVWLLLASFAVITYWNPKWLQELAAAGIRGEASTSKSLGDEALRQRKYELAIAHYEQALKIEPGRVAVLVNLALARTKAGDRAAATRILMDLLEMETSRSAREFVYFNLGELAAAEGRQQDAIEYYRQALGFSVEQARVYSRLGLLHFDRGEYEQARDAFERALASQLDLSLPYRVMLHKSLDALEYDATGLLVLEKELSRDVLVPAIRVQVSQEVGAEQLALYDLETIQRLQETDPDIAETHNRLALVHSHLGDSNEAIKHLEMVLKILPDNVGAKKNLQMLQQMQKSQEGPAAAP